MFLPKRFIAAGAASITAGLALVALSSPAQAFAFTFGAAGDFANGSNYQATINAVDTKNPDFFLALGDTSYSSGTESSWCGKFKNVYNNVVLVAGNHDVGESSGADITKLVQYCPFTLTGLNGTYGRRYYFDYPVSSPLARIIMVSPGLRGSFSSDNTYTVGGAAYNYVANAIDDARAKGIKWIIVGMHKNYISPLEKGNEVGTDFMNLMFSKKVDLVLQGHEHGYARTKQLKCAKTGTFDSTCVVDTDTNFVKGQGLVINILGTGGQGLRGLNTSDSEYPYFASANNTAYGFGSFNVTANSIQYSFVRSTGGTLSDTFTIAEAGIATPTPTVAPTLTPTVAQTPTPTIKPTITPTATPTPSTSCPAISNPIGNASFTLQVASAGNYKAWSRIMGAGDSANSYWLQVDNGCPVHIGDASISTSEWTWVDYRNGNTTTKAMFSLSAGSHTVKLIGQEAGVKLDRVLFVSDLGCIPSGVGENCFTVNPTPTPTPTPTPIPSVVPSIVATPTPFPPTPTPSPVSGTSTTVHKVAIADTHVRSDHPNTNYGSRAELEADGSPHKIAYLKFDLRNITRREIVSAKLRVYVTDSSNSTQNVMMVNNPNWGEDVMTWNTRHARGSKLGTISQGRSGTWKEVNVTGAVSSEQGSLFSIALESSGSDGLDFRSSESSTNKPELVITYR